MIVIKKLFLFQIVVAAILIQVTGRYENLTSSREYYYDLEMDFVYGFPLPYTCVDAIDYENSHPNYSLSEKTKHLQAHHALTARIFAPPYDVKEAPEYSFFPRKGVFIWEHWCNGKFKEFTEPESDLLIVYGTGGILLNSRYLPLPEWCRLYWSMNPGRPMTTLAPMPGPVPTPYLNIHYHFWPCLLYDLLYVGLVIVMVVCLFRNSKPGIGWRVAPCAWTAVAVATQVIIVLGLIHTYYHPGLYSWCDYSWFFHAIYLTNCVTVFVMIYCYSKWLLQGIYRLAKMPFRKNS